MDKDEKLAIARRKVSPPWIVNGCLVLLGVRCVLLCVAEEVSVQELASGTPPQGHWYWSICSHTVSEGSYFFSNSNRGEFVRV